MQAEAALGATSLERSNGKADRTVFGSRHGFGTQRLLAKRAHSAAVTVQRQGVVAREAATG